MDGVGVVLLSPQDYVLPCMFSLTEPCPNNVVEYNALLISMKIVRERGVRNMEVYGDYLLIIKQFCGECEVRHENLIPYCEAIV